MPICNFFVTTNTQKRNTLVICMKHRIGTFAQALESTANEKIIIVSEYDDCIGSRIWTKY